MLIRDKIEICVFLVLIVVLIVFIYKAQTDGTKCMVNPIKYSIKYYSELNNDSMSCLCSFQNINILNILANKTGVYQIEPTYAIQGTPQI